MRVSIIIPTYRRVSSLFKLLSSLTDVVKKKDEVIIVEQGEKHEKEIISYAKKLRLPIHYYFLETPSMTKARNTGAVKAKGEFLLFLDDDVIVTPKLLESHVKNFDDKRVAATVGRVITEGQQVESGREQVGRVNWVGSVSGGYSSEIRQEVDTVLGCNMCWRTSVYRQLGGVDEQFVIIREETDLSIRAKRLGYAIIFEPKALVEHHRATTGGTRKSEGRIQWYVSFFSDETYFFLKHRPTWLLPLYLLTKTEWALRCMFGFGREVSIRSMLTPFIGITEGAKKYQRLKKHYDHWR